MKTPIHQAVLADQVIELLDPKPGQSYFDGTAGYGGHAQLISERIGPSGRMILADRDPRAIKWLGGRFGGKAEIIQSDFLAAAERLTETGESVDMILLDLGVSSPQLDESERGFSFRHTGPLDMRMDSSQELTAAEVVNSYPQAKLAEIINTYGEEHRARAIAARIAAHRPLATTTELASLVAGVVRSDRDTHPATRTFQALRIYVNSELTQLEQALPKLVELLALNGRLAIISFHSLEDRIVKNFFTYESKDCICPPKQPVCTCSHTASLRILTKKAVKGSTDDTINPRARSAKLRAAVKIKTNKRGQK
ncbi:MAG TPA: 16S rRNA (cytosine(1402)-N(4))-methyltransferase RsmH [Candidatus Dormibacteraeota bacterium]|nr:16S rRNA (cytosine(1402)-N(4))-methyltransferase RsmH [Candidatus Dormibacteraeota bacterium]